MGLLDGKVAIVTGAGNGVGRGEAIKLADQGAKVVVNDLGVSVTGEGADKRTADEVVDVIKSRGGEAVANYDDVADFEGAKSIIDTAVDAFGKLDVLVNNAGILRDRMMFSMTEDEFDSVIQGAPQGHLEHHAPRLGVLAQRVEGGPPAPRVDRQHGLERRAPGPGQPVELRRGQGRHRGDDDHRQPRAHALRRARQLHRPRRLHAHGRRRRCRT